MSECANPPILGSPGQICCGNVNGLPVNVSHTPAILGQAVLGLVVLGSITPVYAFGPSFSLSNVRLNILTGRGGIPYPL